jgi:hypothetical protein
LEARWRDCPAAGMRIADLLAAGVAVSLPWSTSAASAPRAYGAAT